MHPFEQRGLGSAPYVYTGLEKKVQAGVMGAADRPGGTCDYCGTSIMYAYQFKAADGRRFKVGSECMMKADRDVTPGADGRLVWVGAGYRTLADIAKVEQAKLDKANRKSKATTVVDLANANRDRAASTLKSQPHPKIPGKTLYDYVTWLTTNGHAKKALTLIPENHCLKSFSEYLRESTDDGVYYHGTARCVLDGIAANGLVHHAAEKTTPDADTDGDRANSIYMAKSEYIALKWSMRAADKFQSAPVILRVTVPFEFQHNVIPDEADPRGVRFRGTIPAEWVTVL